SRSFGSSSGADAEIVAHRSLEHHRRLHDERDATPELAGIERSDVTAIESHRAGGGLDETVETAKQTRLPGSARADKCERVPPLHAERHIVQDFHCWITSTTRIGEREMIDLENRIVPVVGSGNSVVAHCSLVVQNTHPVKLSQASSQDYQLDRQSVSRIFRRLVCAGKYHEIAVSPHIRSQIYPDSETHHVP